jgi:starch synthase
METKKFLFICQEIFPYVPETLASTICRQLPQYAVEQGVEVRIFMPCFGLVNERRYQLHEVQRLSGLNLIISDNDHQLIIKVASIQSARMQVYFIDNYDYFRRKAMDKDEDGKGFDDNDERMIFYTRGVLETMKKLRWVPDIIQCSGWMTSLAPLFIRRAYRTDPFFKDAKVFYSINDDNFDFSINKSFEKKLVQDKITTDDIKLLTSGTIDWEAMTKLAIEYSDGVMQGSPNMNEQWADYLKKTGKNFKPYNEDFKENFFSVYKEYL